MEFGLFSESGYRLHAVTAEALEEDVAELVQGDRLGFCEAWIAEPNNVRLNTVTDANLLICKLAGLTDRIRLGTGIRSLPLLHPVNIVREANLCDHLTGGRYMFGYGGTRMATMDQARQRGLPFDRSEARAVVYEAIDLIMKCWTATEPFDFEGRYWQAAGVNVLPKPFQQPHPPIATACSGASETLEIAARNGFIPLLGRGNDKAEEIREWADAYVQAATGAGKVPSKRTFRTTHFVYVGETDEQALKDAREGLTYVLERRKREVAVFLQSRIPPGGTIDDLTFDYMADNGYYWVGSPETVYQRIKDYYDESGGFGVLLLSVGLPVATAPQRAASMQRFVDQVAPRLAGLDPDRASA